MRRFSLTFVLYCVMHMALAQVDSARALQQVVVTASRTARAQDSLPVPVTVITKKDIQRLGSRRLIDVLREQTGLIFVTDEHGSGLQLQGLDPDYTLVLIDGEPLIGRLTGKLDLSRVTVGNIQRIEIVKGASSSLYGSEALAGVVNIITTGAGRTTNAELSLRGGSNGIVDVTAQSNYAFPGKKTGVQLLANYYRTDGYSTTLPPFYSYSLQGKFRHEFSARSSILVSGRWAYRYQHTDYNFSGPERDATAENDGGLIASWRHAFSSRWNSRLEYYFSRYSTDEKYIQLSTGKSSDTSFFRQDLHRLEWQHDYKLGQPSLLTAGLGGNLESVEATRYPGRQTMQSAYLYTQYQYDPGVRWNVIGGLRGDLHSIYGSQLSPKLALQYHLTKKLSFKTSMGRGFKAPDFRQLYLTFTNPLVGYTVLGTEELKKGALQQMQEAGEITVIYPEAYRAAGDLKAERSWSYNAGLLYKPWTALRVELNAFYNNVNNLILSVPVAGKTNGWFVYSYINVSKVYTKGIELSTQARLTRGLELQAGYQLLYAKDKDIIDSIKAGAGAYGVITNPYTGVVRPAAPADYFGLEQRSRHQLNVKLFYTLPWWGLSAGARANYVSKAGFADQNGNGYIDKYDQFIPAHCLLAFSLEKTFLQPRLVLQLSVENATNYTNALVAGQPGRQFFAGLRWNWNKTIDQSLINKE
ncbi:MAG TPA: TonB-dependent receptor [Puia sp.]|nr:TonB-dependent receptor [Puia sp.]